MFPKIISKMAKAPWSSFFQFQQRWLDAVAGKKGSEADEALLNPSFEICNTWMGFYEKEFRRILSVPPWD